MPLDFATITHVLLSCSNLHSISDLLLEIAGRCNITVIRTTKGFSTLSINSGEFFTHVFYSREQETLNSISIVNVHSGKQVSVMDGISCDGFNALANTLEHLRLINKRSVA